MIDENAMAERMFGDSPNHGDAQRKIERQAIEDDLATPEQAAERSAEWVQQYQELGLNSTESHSLAGLKGNPSAEQRAVWQKEAHGALLRDFGDGAGQALEDAKAYLTKHPGLRDHLHESGLGDHPMWVRIIARKAREARKAGKLG